MAKKEITVFPYSGHDVELVMVKGERTYLKVMKFEEALLVLKNEHPTSKKEKGWKYMIYQLGFSQFKNVIKLE